MSAPIHSIPIEVFLDYLLPQIPITDLCNLACTDRFFASLCADDMFWKRKLKDDLNYSIVDARDKGFKLLYRGIRRPHVYVWGQKDQGRLGISNVDEIYKAHGEGIPFPVELPMKDTRIVSIVAGGWSFAALDEEGHLHVWGQLDSGMSASRNNWGDFGESGHRQSTPATLILPEPIASISSGRRHLLALDQKHQVWLLASWGRPALLRSPQINDASSRVSRVIQVAAGWNHIALLTESGSVFVEWPFDGELGDKVTSHHETLAQAEGRGKDTTLKEGESALKCATWELDHPLIELPPVPAQGLPVLAKPVGVDDDVPREELKIIKIAAGEHFVIALTNQGHVLKLAAQPERGGDTTQLKEDIKYGRLTWQYLRHFSELEVVQNAFREKGLEPPTSVRITHISATFKTFTAYSVGETSVVLLGTGLDTTTPTIIPGLQNRNIVSVVLGDYHYGALTQDGVMLTWGKHSNGALGLGDPLKLPAGSPGGFAEPVEPNPGPATEGGMHHVPIIRRRRAVPDVAEPTVVRFDHEDGKNDKFVFAITASGWHTAALVIDLDPTAASGTAAGTTASTSTPQNLPAAASSAGLHTYDDTHEHPNAGGAADDETAPQMPGSFFPRTTFGTRPGRGRVFPQHGRLHAVPVDQDFINNTFGAYTGPHAPDLDEPGLANPYAPTESVAPPRAPFVGGRIGFAGRGLSRGGAGRGMSSQAGHHRVLPGGWQQHEDDDTPVASSTSEEPTVVVAPGDDETVIHHGEVPADNGAPIPGLALRAHQAQMMRGMPPFRLGYAARGAYRGTGIGHAMMAARGAGDNGDAHAEDPPHTDEETPSVLRERGGGPGEDNAETPANDASTDVPAGEAHSEGVEEASSAPASGEDGDAPAQQASVPRGLRGVRIGFAGRGAYRGEGFGRVLAGGYRGLPGGRGRGAHSLDDTSSATAGEPQSES